MYYVGGRGVIGLCEKGLTELRGGPARVLIKNSDYFLVEGGANK